MSGEQSTMFDYDKLLERLYSKVPKRMSKYERFEVPPVQVIHIGSQTIIKNFRDIVDVLRRDPRLVMRFLLRELATAGSYDEDSGMLAVNIRVSSTVLNKMIQMFTKQYVICPTCGRPDTKLEKLKSRAWILVCEACGAETPVKPF